MFCFVQSKPYLNILQYLTEKLSCLRAIQIHISIIISYHKKDINPWEKIIDEGTQAYFVPLVCRVIARSADFHGNNRQKINYWGINP